MMDRAELLKVVSDARTDEIVVSTMSANKDWARLSPAGLDLYVSGAMGYASSVGLGLALAQPGRKVIVLDGDGSLLMNLGTLVTIAGQAPPNLLHLVLENDLYEVPGGLPLPGAGKYNLNALARASGIKQVYHFEELPEFREHLGALLKERGPVFVTLKVARGSSEPLPAIPQGDVARRLEVALRRH